MHIDWWTLGLQTVNVAVLIWVLGRFLFRPVARIISDRQALAGADLAKAKAALAEAEASRDAARAATADLATQRQQMLAAAQSEAAHQKETLLAAAQSEAEAARRAALADLVQARATEARALSDQAAQLAGDIAARLLQRLPDDARVLGFIDGLAAAVAALPDATRDSIGREGPVRLRTARALTAPETEAVNTALAQVLGRPVALAPEVAPELIAGLELETPHAVVHNNFHADLARIAQELTRHD
ncbi:MAG: F0F1 ATP synthase subunit delta [Paracoccaceae bacterium]|jgi:F-type H+-transporting ATPase subunit b|nr:F0F1 ATP synthase subunit delta [Paracoccaceae bacterium]